MFSRNLHRKQQLSLFFLSFTPTPTRACVRVYLSVRRRGGEKEERSSLTPPRLARRRVVAPTWPCGSPLTADATRGPTVAHGELPKWQIE
jgi:hypothetical protein